MIRYPSRVFRPFRLLQPVIVALIACLVSSSALADRLSVMAGMGPATEQVDPGGYAEIVHVSASTGSDSKGDGSADHPWATLQKAMAAVPSASEEYRVAVLVAAGAYNSQTIVCREFVDLFGGFSAGNWQRDIFENETILDGRQARRVLIGADNSRIDGFVIRNGRAFGPGGGIFCDNTSPVVSNNRFLGNHTIAPSGIRADRIHQAGNRGGALAAWYDAAPTVRNNLFAGNWTEFGDGGAVAAFGWSRLEGRPQPLIESNVFVGNRSGTKDFYRTRSSSGGAIVCSHEVDATIRNNIIAHNQAMGRSDAGGIYVEYYSRPVIAGNWIVGNEGDDDGGGIYAMRDGEPLIEGNLIAGNWTTGGGVGGIRLSKEGRMRLVGNAIVHNQTGGGLALVDGHAVVEGNLIAENKGGAGLLYRQTFSYFQPSLIRGNRIFGNETVQIELDLIAGVSPILEDNTEEVSDGDVLAPGLESVIVSASFDPRAFQTEFVVNDELAGMVGRAIRVGDQWSMVASVIQDRVRVWGDFTSGQDDLTGQVLIAIPDYAMAP